MWQPKHWKKTARKALNANCGRIVAACVLVGFLTRGQAEFSRAGGHGRRRAGAVGPASGLAPGGKAMRRFGKNFEKHIRRAGWKRCRPAPARAEACWAGLGNDIRPPAHFCSALNAVNQMAFQGRVSAGAVTPSAPCSHSAGGCLWVGCFQWASGAFSGEQGAPRHALPLRVFLAYRAPHKAHGTCGAGAGCGAVPVGAHDCGPTGKAVFLRHGALYPSRKPALRPAGSVSALAQADEGAENGAAFFLFASFICGMC